MIRAAGLAVTCYCRGGLFPAADEAGRRAALDDNRRAVDEAAAIGARILVLDRRRAAEGQQGPRRRARAGPRRHRRAVAPCARGRRAAGDRAAASDVCRRPRLREHAGARQRSLRRSSAKASASRSTSITSGGTRTWPRQIERAGTRILTYHVCDWLVPTKDLLLDRGMPGDGVIDLRAIRAMVEATGYDGLIDVEIFSARELVEARARRGAADLPGAASDRGVIRRSRCAQNEKAPHGCGAFGSPIDRTISL